MATRIRWLGLLLFGLAWLSYDHYRPWVNFHAEALAIAGLGLLVAAGLARLPGAASFPRPALWLFALTALPWLQYFAGISLFAGDALLCSLYLSALAGSVFVGFRGPSAMDPPGPDRSVLHLLWLVALVSATIGLLQWLALQGPLAMYVVQTDPGDRAMGNLGQPNQLATLLLMGVIGLAFAYESGAIGRWGFYLGGAFLSGVAVLAQSRASMLSILVAAAFLVWKADALRRLRRSDIACWLGLFFGGVMLLPWLSDALLLGAARSTPLTDSAGRWLMWQQMAVGILQSPWWGFGWNQTPTAHMAGALSVPGSMTFTNAHNVVLDLLAWNGIPLGLLIVLAAGAWFVSRMRRVQRVDGVLAMAALLPLAVHSQFEYPFAYAYFLVAGGLLVGIVEAALPQSQPVAVRRRWPWLVLGSWAVVGSYLCHEYLRIEEDFRVVRFENLNIGRTPADYAVPRVWMISHMAEMLQAARIQAAPGMDAAELERLRKVALRFPYGALTLRYAIALGLNHDPAGASRQMELIRGVYGSFYYAAAKAVVQDLQRHRYPELQAVRLP